jgi:hypothetical protein
MQVIDLNSAANAGFQSGLHRARLRYPELDLERCKLIGFGADDLFEKFYPQLDIKLDYTVCVSEIETGLIADGDVKCGIPVHHASRLREENPDEVLIVVFFGRWYDAMRYVSHLGPFRCMRAVHEYGEGGGLGKRLQAVLGEAAVAAPGQADRSVGLVVQGAVMGHITPMVLAANRRKFPFAAQILSTWDNTPPALLEACAPHVDEIVTSPVPVFAGGLNAIMQRDSTRAGLIAMAGRGVEYAFKTRTDQSVIGAVDIDKLLALARSPIDGPDAGMRERILFAPQFSWRFIPYHLTDQLQFGRVKDLLEFWQTRDESIAGMATLPANAPAHFLTLCTPESCILRCYLRRIGVDYELTLASYWKIVAERFALMPEAEISMFNWKAIALFDIPMQGDAGARRMAQPASLQTSWRSADWNDLRKDPASFEDLAHAVGRMGLKVLDYDQNTPFDLPMAGPRDTNL